MGHFNTGGVPSQIVLHSIAQEAPEVCVKISLSEIYSFQHALYHAECDTVISTLLNNSPLQADNTLVADIFM